MIGQHPHYKHVSVFGLFPIYLNQKSEKFFDAEFLVYNAPAGYSQSSSEGINLLDQYIGFQTNFCLPFQFKYFCIDAMILFESKSLIAS